MLDYSFNKENNILLAKSSGNNKIEDIIGHYEYLAKSEKYPERLKVIIDINEVNLNVAPEEIEQVYISLNKAVNNYNLLYEAILVKKPYETAIATLFEREFKQIENYIFKVFYTETAAFNWLLEF